MTNELSFVLQSKRLLESLLVLLATLRQSTAISWLVRDINSVLTHLLSIRKGGFKFFVRNQSFSQSFIELADIIYPLQQDVKSEHFQSL
jgi:hypothetical protein